MASLRQASRKPMPLPVESAAILRKFGTPRGMRVFGHVDSDTIERARVAREAGMAKRICELLNFYYPGHVWECTVDERHGGAQLRIAVLMTGPQCFFIRFDDIATEADFKARIRNAGGELLERFKIPRSTFDLTRFIEAKPKAVFHHKMRLPE